MVKERVTAREHEERHQGVLHLNVNSYKQRGPIGEGG